jgi:hypothetical protein
MGRLSHSTDHGTCVPTAYVFSWHLFSRGTCVPTVYRGTCFSRHTFHLGIFSRGTWIPPAHVFPWHMFSHGTCFPEAHVFPRLPVAHVFPRHTFHHGTYFPTVHVFPLYPLILLKQTPKKGNPVSQYRSWHMFSHGTFPWHMSSHRHMFSLGICLPTAHVFPRHMCSHGLPWHMLFYPAHVSPRHIFSQGTWFPVTLVDTYETNTKKKHVFPRNCQRNILRLFATIQASLRSLLS